MSVAYGISLGANIFSVAQAPTATNIATSGTWFAASFNVASSCVINSVYLYQSSASSGGTLEAYILTDEQRTAPPTTYTALSSTTTPLSAAGIIEFSFSNVTILPGKRYWIAIKNTGSVSIGFYVTRYQQIGFDSVGNDMWQTSVFNGTAWTGANYQTTDVCVRTIDNNIIGLLPITGGFYATRSWYANATSWQEFGASMITPNTWVNVVGVTCDTYEPNSNINIRYKLYVNGSLVATTMERSSAYGGNQLPFQTSIKIPPNSDIWITMAPSNGASTTGARIYSNTLFSNSGDINFIKARPYSMQAITLAYGASPTKTPDVIPLIGLCLDATTPFPNAPIDRRTFNAMR